MAAVFATLGPVEHYIRPFSGGAWSYLGTALASPESDEEEMLLPLINDLGGRSAPMDYVRDRRRNMVTTTLSRFNRTTLRLLKGDTVIGPGTGEYIEGAVRNGAPAQLYSSFELLMVNSYGNTFSSADQPAGKCWYCAIPRKFREDGQGTRSQVVSILFECIGVFNVAARFFEHSTEDPGYWGAVTPE